MPYMPVKHRVTCCTDALIINRIQYTFYQPLRCYRDICRPAVADTAAHQWQCYPVKLNLSETVQSRSAQMMSGMTSLSAQVFQGIRG